MASTNLLQQHARFLKALSEQDDDEPTPEKGKRKRKGTTATDSAVKLDQADPRSIAAAVANHHKG